jgi:N-acetylglucosaminyldiphosphoundecaprenol N-acetyl-beta-D-mannosaminyltransferase
MYVNAHCLNIANQNNRYHEVLKSADLVYADGVGVVLAANILQREKIKKITSRDWLDEFCKVSIEDDLRIYLLGAKPEINRKSRIYLENKYSGLKVVGASDGYFQGKSEPEILSEIDETNPHVLFVAMGTPKQEQWIAENREKIAAPVCWAVGAMFDVLAGSEPGVPAWMNAIGLEWFWRLLMDPTGKWKRYIIGNPLFLARVLRQLASERLLMRSGKD